ncbi:MAG TPA: MaoC family dehydratase [Acidimicrobiales bacterium]|jgi:acyl dehydratase|nr:MaoC family dehydratase [Acidimicrobiales bacterium]
MTTIIDGIDGLKASVGQHLGYSDWVEITQDQVNQFADATGDHQWIHVDVERAKAGPFGGPIAHGYLTLALGPGLLPTIIEVRGISMGVNYGANKIRFPAPVPVGSKLRLGARLLAVDDVAGGVQGTVELTFEVDGASKPSCVAEVLYRYYL